MTDNGSAAEPTIRARRPATFVLVHGAWHGGWCWRRVADLLRARGHRVFTPTLTGLAERSHLAGREVGLSTHVADVVNLIRWEGLQDVVLCGHSYGGMVVSGVAEEAPAGAIGSIVFLDAFLPEHGRSLLDYTTVAGREGGPMVEEGEATGFVTPIPAEVFAVNDADRAWVDAQCTPQPYATLTEKAKMTGARERIARKAYVLATGYAGLAFPVFAAKVKDRADWRYYEALCGHDVMLDEPELLTGILEDAAGIQ
jgi:pimeloyl-ACP methyl ester carboxylesterase